MTLSRRDRAACVLALECLRHVETSETYCGSTLESAIDALQCGRVTELPWALVDAADEALDNHGVASRLLRARLALYLRAVLRVDERERYENDATGEVRYVPPLRTRVVCSGCGEVCGGYQHGELMTTVGKDGPPDVCPRTGRIERARNAIPLWSQAPATKGDR